MDRPVTPLFVPAKTGADVETQIMPGDLFNFDQEVKVIFTHTSNKIAERLLQ